MAARTWLALLNVISLVLLVVGEALALMGLGSIAMWQTAALPGIPAVVFIGTIPVLWLLHPRTPKSDPGLENGVAQLDEVLRCVQADLGSCVGMIDGLPTPRLTRPRPPDVAKPSWRQNNRVHRSVRQCSRSAAGIVARPCGLDNKRYRHSSRPASRSAVEFRSPRMGWDDYPPA